MPQKNEWTLRLEDFSGGLTPIYWTQTYPDRGKANQLGVMTDCDIWGNYPLLGQGPNFTAYTNSSLVTTQIKGFSRYDSAAPTYIFGGGGSTLYAFNSAAFTLVSSADWPRLVNHPTATGESVVDCELYSQKSATEFLFYSYNHSTGGDVGRHTTNTSTFDDDYLSTVPTGAFSLSNASEREYPLEIGPDDVLYIGNTRYVSKLDGTTATEAALSLPLNFFIYDIRWMTDRLYISAVYPGNTSTIGQQFSIIFVWDGIQTRHLYDIEAIGKKITAMYPFNGVMMLWYADKGGYYNLGYIEGEEIRSLIRTSDNILPLGYQIDEYEGSLIWKSNNDGKLWGWGSISPEIPPVLFQFGTHAGGGIALNNGIIISAGTTGVSYWRGSGYATTSLSRTLMFNATKDDKISVLDKLIVYVKGANGENIATGARVDITIDYMDQDGAVQTAATPRPNSGQLSFSNYGAVGRVVFHDVNIRCQKFRLNFNWANGSTSNPVNIERVEVKGHYIDYR